MRFEELADLLPRLEGRLRQQYQLERRRTKPPFRPYVSALAEFTLRGGKRFRALLVLAGYHLASSASPEPALEAATAFEHFQSWMLIHDDVIDHSEVRRGGPTLHRSYEEELRSRSGLGEPGPYGVGIAITLGDLEEPFTIQAILDTPVPAERRLRALAEYVRTTRETAYGQALDIRNGSLPIEQVGEADVLAVHTYKTSVYTVTAPLRIGAILGGAPEGLLQELESFGRDLGVAFQLRDDVLGTGFSASASGKSANDLTEGKRTLLVVRAWKEGDADVRSALQVVLGNPSATPEQIDAAREAIRRSGSLDYSERKIATLARRAEKRITSSKRLDADQRELLREIADRLVHRAK